MKFVQIIEFTSSRIAEQMAKLCDSGPTFLNLDVRREEQD